jgi:hypothetical protein
MPIIPFLRTWPGTPTASNLQGEDDQVSFLSNGRLPVIFRGLINKDSLLRLAVHWCSQKRPPIAFLAFSYLSYLPRRGFFRNEGYAEMAGRGW